MVLILLKILAITGFIVIVKGTQYIAVNQYETWRKAHEVCSENGLKLSPLNKEDIGSELQNCSLDGMADLWTSTFKYTTPYLSLVGCFTKMTIPKLTLKKASVIECQISCEEYPRFGITKNECTCLETEYKLDTVLNNEQCNYTCDDGVLCGGKDAVSVYERVEKIPVLGLEQVLSSNVSTNCVVYQCLNNIVTYQEKDCTDSNIEYAIDYFSCTFEPGDDCFLVQRNDLVWSIQNTPLRNNSIYKPSYYAFADLQGDTANHTALLMSDTKFKASSWCLRFRYLANSVIFMKLMTWDVIRNKTESLVEIRNATEPFNTDHAWYNFEHNFASKKDFKLLFSFQQSNQRSNISLDDVSMILGSCEETLTVLLNQRGELQCTFGGSVDICFRQALINDGTDWKYSNNELWLGKNDEGKSAILISKFELEDMFVKFCMGYIMLNGSLVFYSKFGQEKVEETPNDMQVICSSVAFYAKTKIYINGTILNSSSSAKIRIQFINITVINRYGQNGNNRQIQRPVPDPYAPSTFDVNNVRCLVHGPKKFTNTIRIQGQHLPKNGIPSAVLIYRTDNSAVFWEKFMPTTKRQFICENDTGDVNECRDYLQKKTLKEENKSAVMIGVIAASSFVFITCLVLIIVFIRRYAKHMHEKGQYSTDETANDSYINVEFHAQSKSVYETLQARDNSDEQMYDRLHQ